MKPKWTSAQIFIIRLTRRTSSAERGIRKERPTFWPLLGES
jgi:hypothetical protein